MNKDQLIESARELGPFPVVAAKAYNKAADRLVIFVNETLLNQPDIGEMIPDSCVEMMKNNHDNHVLFIGAMLTKFDATVLVETILWVLRVYRSRGFSPSYWPAQLQTWISAMRDELNPDEIHEIIPLYEWILIHLPSFDQLNDTHH